MAVRDLRIAVRMSWSCIIAYITLRISTLARILGVVQKRSRLGRLSRYLIINRRRAEWSWAHVFTLLTRTGVGQELKRAVHTHVQVKIHLRQLMLQGVKPRILIQKGYRSVKTASNGARIILSARYPGIIVLELSVLKIKNIALHSSDKRQP